MPIRRKLQRLGKSSYAVVLPKQWLKNIERVTGQRPQEVLLEIDSNITVIPDVSIRHRRKLQNQIKPVTQIQQTTVTVVDEPVRQEAIGN
jgi:antitoxin component of MazEF toxin-antitoxin module